MKKIISTIFVVLFSLFLHGQTATLSIGNVTATPGQTVNIPVTVSSPTPLLATEFNMTFNPSVLNESSITYVNFHPNFPIHEWVYNAVNGMMLLNWVSSTLVPVPVQGTITLFEIQAQYLGGSTDIVWTLDLLVDGNLQIIPVNSINGSVSEYVAPQITVELPHVLASPGTTILIPVTISGASAQGIPIVAAELNIDFNPAVIDYTTIQFKNFHPLMPGFEWVYNAISGKMLLNWVSSTLQPVAIPDGSTMFEVECTYLGGQTALAWSLVILVDGNIQEAPFVAINGSISPSSPASTVFNGIGNWINATLWSNGVPGPNSIAVIQSGHCIITGPAFTHNLTVNAGAALTIESSGTLNVGNNLLLASLPNNTPSGSLINKGNLNVSGQTTIQRWLSGGQNHFISTPSVGTTLAMLYNSNNPGYFFEYSEPLKTWVNLYQLNTPLIPGKGYSLNYQNNELVQINGPFNNLPSYNANISYTISKSIDHGWNLVGNPYPSALNWEAPGWTKVNLEGGIYFYDGTNYQAYNGGYGVPSTATQFIPAMQGFFVKATGTGAQLIIPKSAQVHSSQPYYKEGQNVQNALRVRISNNVYADETLIRFDENATNSFDAELDAYKLFSFNEEVPQIYTLGTISYAINALPSQGNTTWQQKVIPVALKIGIAGQYSFEAIGMETFDPAQVVSIELFDAVTQEYIDLLQNPVYTFSINAGYNTTRFRIYINRSVTGINEPANGKIVIYGAERTIYIENARGTAIVYNLSGQEILRAKLIDNDLNTLHLHKGGMYLVRIIDGEVQTASEKIYLK